MQAKSQRAADAKLEKLRQLMRPSNVKGQDAANSPTSTTNTSATTKTTAPSKCAASATVTSSSSMGNNASSDVGSTTSDSPSKADQLILQDQDIPDLSDSLTDSLVNATTPEHDGQEPSGANDSLQEIDQASLAAILTDVNHTEEHRLLVDVEETIRTLEYIESAEQSDENNNDDDDNIVSTTERDSRLSPNKNDTKTKDSNTQSHGTKYRHRDTSARNKGKGAAEERSMSNTSAHKERCKFKRQMSAKGGGGSRAIWDKKEQHRKHNHHQTMVTLVGTSLENAETKTEAVKGGEKSVVESVLPDPVQHLPPEPHYEPLPMDNMNMSNVSPDSGIQSIAGSPMNNDSPSPNHVPVGGIHHDMEAPSGYHHPPSMALSDRQKALPPVPSPRPDGSMSDMDKDSDMDTMSTTKITSQPAVNPHSIVKRAPVKGQSAKVKSKRSKVNSRRLSKVTSETVSSTTTVEVMVVEEDRSNDPGKDSITSKTTNITKTNPVTSDTTQVPKNIKRRGRPPKGSARYLSDADLLAKSNSYYPTPISERRRSRSGSTSDLFAGSSFSTHRAQSSFSTHQTTSSFSTHRSPNSFNIHQTQSLDNVNHTAVPKCTATNSNQSADTSATTQTMVDPSARQTVSNGAIKQSIKLDVTESGQHAATVVDKRGSIVSSDSDNSPKQASPHRPVVDNKHSDMNSPHKESNVTGKLSDTPHKKHTSPTFGECDTSTPFKKRSPFKLQQPRLFSTSFKPAKPVISMVTKPVISMVTTSTQPHLKQKRGPGRPPKQCQDGVARVTAISHRTHKKPATTTITMSTCLSGNAAKNQAAAKAAAAMAKSQLKSSAKSPPISVGTKPAAKSLTLSSTTSVTKPLSTLITKPSPAAKPSLPLTKSSTVSFKPSLKPSSPSSSSSKPTTVSSSSPTLSEPSSSILSQESGAHQKQVMGQPVEDIELDSILMSVQDSITSQFDEGEDGFNSDFSPSTQKTVDVSKTVNKTQKVKDRKSAVKAQTESMKSKVHMTDSGVKTKGSKPKLKENKVTFAKKSRKKAKESQVTKTVVKSKHQDQEMVEKEVGVKEGGVQKGHDQIEKEVSEQKEKQSQNDDVQTEKEEQIVTPKKKPKKPKVHVMMRNRVRRRGRKKKVGADIQIALPIPVVSPVVSPASTSTPTKVVRPKSPVFQCPSPPSFPPSHTPPLPPSLAPPSLAPSLPPSLAPSLPPPLAPSLSSSLAPSVPPSLAPSLLQSLPPTLPPALTMPTLPNLAHSKLGVNCMVGLDTGYAADTSSVDLDKSIALTMPVLSPVHKTFYPPFLTQKHSPKLEVDSKQKKKKKKNKHFKSKHKNIIDPVFESDLDSMRIDLENLTISENKPGFLNLAQEDGEIPMPTIFQLNQNILRRKRKRELHLGKVTKKLESKREFDINLGVRERVKRTRKKKVMLDIGDDKEDTKVVNSEQCLPLKKRHKLMQQAAEISMSSATCDEQQVQGTGSKMIAVVAPKLVEKRRVGRPRKHPLPEDKEQLGSKTGVYSTLMQRYCKQKLTHEYLYYFLKTVKV